MPTKASRNVTFLTSPFRRGEMPQYFTGEAVQILGLPAVVHSEPRPNGKGKSWAVSEPTTGCSLTTDQSTRANALRIAVERCARFGGLGALLHNIAHRADDASTAATTTGGMRPSANQLHSAELAYLAGGPLDAPERMAAGSTVAASYTKRPETVSVARLGLFA